MCQETLLLLKTGGREAGVLLEREQSAITLLSQDLLIGRERCCSATVVLVRRCTQIWKDELMRLQLTAAELTQVALVRDLAAVGCVCSLRASVAHTQE